MVFNRIDNLEHLRKNGRGVGPALASVGTILALCSTPAKTDPVIQMMYVLYIHNCCGSGTFYGYF